MNRATVVITDGRGDLLTQMIESASTNIEGFHDHVALVGVDDSGSVTYATWLDETYPMVEWHHHSEREGLAEAIRTAWSVLDLDSIDYILHLEDDVNFHRLIPLSQWRLPLAFEPMLAQVCLQRGPQAPTEIEAGGILRLYEQTGPIEPFTGGAGPLGGVQWTEHRKLFSLQPNIYPAWVAKVGWPEHGGETEFTAKLLAQYPEARFAYLGHPDDEPHYEHPGYARRQAGWTV